jgi:hypothetical protein
VNSLSKVLATARLDVKGAENIKLHETCFGDQQIHSMLVDRRRFDEPRDQTQYTSIAPGSVGGFCAQSQSCLCREQMLVLGERWRPSSWSRRPAGRNNDVDCRVGSRLSSAIDGLRNALDMATVIGVCTGRSGLFLACSV